MKQKLNILKRYPIATYFLLVFVISWGSILLFLGPDGLPVATDQVQMVGMALLLGPTLSMLILTAVIDGKAGFRSFWRRLTNWKVGGSNYAIALLTAPVTAVITLLVLSLFDPQFFPKIFIAEGKAQLIGMGIAAGLFIAFFEEIGWTGFVLPRMLDKYGVLSSGLILGALWGLWHLPPFWQADSFSALLPLLILLARLFSWIIAYRVLMVRLYKRTQSLLLVILMHMSLVVCMIVIEPPLQGWSLLTYILSWTVVLWAVVFIGGMLNRSVR